MPDEAPVILVTSPVLQQEAATLLHRFFPTGHVLIWQAGDDEAAKRIHLTLLTCHAPLCISFYNDYLFSPAEIAAQDCLVNIHPALPGLRGRGYDILPLLHEHPNHGATLHFVNERIDAGKIIDVISRPIPPGCDYPTLRAGNQSVSLDLLHRLLAFVQSQDSRSLRASLEIRAMSCTAVWEGEALNSTQLAARLRAWRKQVPAHPALRNLPAALENPETQ